MSVRSRLSDLLRGPSPSPSPMDRMDSTSSTTGTNNLSSLSGASVSNAISGLGAYRDSSAQARPNIERDYLTTDELVALMRGGLYRRICGLHPSWATVKGWQLTDDSDDEKPLKNAMDALKVRRVFRRADTWGRGLGECLVLMVTDDPDPLSEPLRPEKVRHLHRLEIFDRREIWPTRFNSDIEAGPIGEPTHYNLVPRRAGYSPTGDRRKALSSVHVSRLLRFYGDDLMPSELAFAGQDYSASWGADAIGQTLWDGIRNLSQTGQAGAKVAQELSIAVFKLAPPRGAGDESSSWLGRVRTLNMMKSVVQAVLLNANANEDFHRVAANPTGFKDISDHARLELSLLLGAPMTLLFGEAPGGLNTDGSSWQALWYQSVADYQLDRYEPPLRKLAEVVYHVERGGVPDEWGIEFNPLGDLSEKERAEIRVLHTQADSAAILDGVLTPDEIRRHRYAQTGGYQVSMQALEEMPEPARTPTPTDPEALEEARRMVEEKLAEQEANREDASEDTLCLLVPVPESALEEHRSWKAKAEEIVGPLSHDEPPHVTVLYLGDVPPERDAEVVALARPVAEAMSPQRMIASGLMVLGSAAVLEHDAWTFREMNEKLLRALAHLVTAKQFPGFRAHETLGYSETMRPEDVGRLLELQRDWAKDHRAEEAPGWIASRLELRRGSRVVATFPFLGNRQDGEEE